MWMRYVEIPQFPVLRGEQAVNALQDYIAELKGQENSELTEKQVAALVKLARGLISSIEAEKQAVTSGKDLKRKRSATFALSLFQSPLTASPHLLAVQRLI